MLSPRGGGGCYDVTNSFVGALLDDASAGNPFCPQVLQQFLLKPTANLELHKNTPPSAIKLSSSDEAVNLCTKYIARNEIENGAMNVSTKAYHNMELGGTVSPNFNNVVTGFSNESCTNFPTASQWHTPQMAAAPDFRPVYAGKCTDLNRNNTEMIDQMSTRYAVESNTQKQSASPMETNRCVSSSPSSGYNTVTDDVGVNPYFQATTSTGFDQNKSNATASCASDFANKLDPSFHRHIHATCRFVDKPAYDLWIKTYGAGLVYVTKILGLSFVTIRRGEQILMPFDCIHDSTKYDLAPLLWQSVMTLLPSEFDVVKHISPCVRTPCAVPYDHVMAAVGRSGWLLIDTILVPYLRRHDNISLVPFRNHQGTALRVRLQTNGKQRM